MKLNTFLQPAWAEWRKPLEPKLPWYDRVAYNFRDRIINTLGYEEPPLPEPHSFLPDIQRLITEITRSQSVGVLRGKGRGMPFNSWFKEDIPIGNDRLGFLKTQIAGNGALYRASVHRVVTKDEEPTDFLVRFTTKRGKPDLDTLSLIADNENFVLDGNIRPQELNCYDGGADQRFVVEQLENLIASLDALTIPRDEVVRFAHMASCGEVPLPTPQPADDTARLQLHVSL